MHQTLKTLTLTLIPSLLAAQIVVPDGTRVRLRLEQSLSSGTAETGQTVELSVTQEVRVGDTVVIANGAPATGSVILAQSKKRLGRAGKIDFTVDRVMAVDGSWIPLRYTKHKKQGEGRGLTTGILTGGLLVFGGPFAAPFGLLVKGKDIEISKGMTIEAFADENHYLASAAPAGAPAVARTLPQAPATLIRNAYGNSANHAGLSPQLSITPNPTLLNNSSLVAELGQRDVAPQNAAAAAMVTVQSSRPAAEIELDGVYLGSTPSTLQLPAGTHEITVRHGRQTWRRTVQITPGSQITINAVLTQ